MVICDSFFSFHCRFPLIWGKLAPSLPLSWDSEEITPLAKMYSEIHMGPNSLRKRQLSFENVVVFGNQQDFGLYSI